MKRRTGRKVLAGITGLALSFAMLPFNIQAQEELPEEEITEEAPPAEEEVQKEEEVPQEEAAEPELPEAAETEEEPVSETMTAREEIYEADGESDYTGKAGRYTLTFSYYVYGVNETINYVIYDRTGGELAQGTFSGEEEQEVNLTKKPGLIKYSWTHEYTDFEERTWLVDFEQSHVFTEGTQSLEQNDGEDNYTFANVSIAMQYENPFSFSGLGEYSNDSGAISYGTLEAYVNGSSVTNAKEGEAVTLRLSPKNGARFEDISLVSDDEYEPPIDMELSADGVTCTFTMPGANVTVNPEIVQESVDYIDEDGNLQECNEYIVFTKECGTTLSDGWYVVDGNVTQYERVVIDGTVHMILPNGTEWKTEKGIFVPADAELIICGQTGDFGRLSAHGSQYSAGIGGERNSGYGNITINGGTITATGGTYASGIGGGEYNDTGAMGTVMINGGIITATGGKYGAGIGAGEDRTPGPIIINGGEVTATGGEDAAGIGGGNGGSGGSLEIHGGKVTATGTGEAAGIGGGNYSGGGAAGGTIEITDGNIKATGGKYGAGIGGGDKGKGADITITGGTINAAGGQGGAGIGSGDHTEESSGTFLMTGGDVTATGGDRAAGIGSGFYSGDTAKITISGGIVNAYGGDNQNGSEGGAGIGGGYLSSASNIEITDGKVYSNSGCGAAAIGGGFGRGGKMITISGGEVYAYGYGTGTGIGGGQESQTYTIINLNGGKITATGGSHAAGIGSSSSGDSPSIYIRGAEVLAYGGDGGAGIGGGRFYESTPYSGSVSTLIIESGTVTAFGGEYGAGIGNGQNGAGGTIKINGGTVKGYGGLNAAGIGGSGIYNSRKRTNVNYIGITINGGEVYGQGNGYGSGIGTGSLAIENVRQNMYINGGTVTAVAGEQCSHAFAQGGTGTEIITYNLNIGDTMRVLSGTSLDALSTSTKDNRVHDAIFSNAAKIQECEHTSEAHVHSFTGHTYECDFCNAAGAGEFPHEFNEEGICTACGAEKAVVTFTSALYGGTMEPAEGAKGQNYTLPETTTFEVPEGTTLTGWKIDSETKLPGEEITVPGDITAEAQWGALAEPEFNGHQLVLSGTLGLRFGVLFPADFDSEGSYMTFTVNGEEQRVNTGDADSQNGLAVFTCYLNTLQMAEEIEAVFHYGDKTITQTYSLTDYFTYFDENAESYNEKTLRLVKAVADYGYYAQPYLVSVNSLDGRYVPITKHYADSYDYNAVKSDVASYTFAKGISDSAVQNASYKLSLDSDTALSVLMLVPEGTELTASAVFGGKTFTAEKLSDTVYSVKVTGIKASQLGDTITVNGTAEGDFTITVSALSYVRTVINSDKYGEDAKNTVAALYEYYQAVKAY